MERFKVSTRDRVDMVDITSEVREIVRASGVRDGICTVFVPHTTAGVTINENADPDVQRDMMMGTNRMVPNMDFRHAEGNSDGHIKSTLYGPSLTVIIAGRDLVLGTWQCIYLCEFDGPRDRNCFIKCMKG